MVGALLSLAIMSEHFRVLAVLYIAGDAWPKMVIALDIIELNAD